MPDPRDPGPGEVLVRVRAVGICGSDTHHYLEGSCAGTASVYPSVLGHEPAGEIAEIGKGVEGFKPGMKVALEPTLTCRRCEACLSGRGNLCPNAVFMGGVQEPGLLREYAVMPTANVVRVPEQMGFAAITVVEPLAVLLHALNLAELRVGETVAVMGAGPIGLLAVAVSKIAGASRIIVADRVPHRLELARKFGADAAVDFTKKAVSEAVMDLTGGQGAHVVIDAAGKPESIRNGLLSVRSGGRLVVIGIPSQQEVAFNFWEAMNREVSIYVQKRSNANDHEAIDMLRRGVIDADAFVTHRFPLDRGAEAFETAVEYSDGVGKAVIEL